MKTYNGGDLKEWYCKVDQFGNAIRNNQSSIGTLGGMIYLYHKGELRRSCYKFSTFKKVTELDKEIIGVIINQQGYCMADRRLSSIPPRMLINEYWLKSVEEIKRANKQ